MYVYILIPKSQHTPLGSGCREVRWHWRWLIFFEFISKTVFFFFYINQDNGINSFLLIIIDMEGL